MTSPRGLSNIAGLRVTSVNEHIAAARRGITQFFATLRAISLLALRSRPQPPKSHETTHYMADVVYHNVSESFKEAVFSRIAGAHV